MIWQANIYDAHNCVEYFCRLCGMFFLDDYLNQHNINSHKTLQAWSANLKQHYGTLKHSQISSILIDANEYLRGKEARRLEEARPQEEARQPEQN